MRRSVGRSYSIFNTPRKSNHSIYQRLCDLKNICSAKQTSLKVLQRQRIWLLHIWLTSFSFKLKSVKNGFSNCKNSFRIKILMLHPRFVVQFFISFDAKLYTFLTFMNKQLFSVDATTFFKLWILVHYNEWQVKIRKDVYSSILYLILQYLHLSILNRIASSLLKAF